MKQRLMIAGALILGVLAAQTNRTAAPGAAYQRFVSVPPQTFVINGLPWSGVFALDTKTGALCLTYQGTGEAYDKWKLDSCVDLYHRY